MSKGTLYLIPTTLADGALDTIPPATRAAIASLHYFLAEDIRTARRYLSSLKLFARLEDLQFEELNKDTGATDVSRRLAPLLAGHSVGVLSESGCPGIADPGSLAVKFAHQHQVRVVPLVGPSSILLALMGSGLNGQQFAFHGYLPIDVPTAEKKIRELERESRLKNQTQLLIETPYRNNAVLKKLLTTLSPSTELCIAFHLTSPEENIRTKTVADWRTSVPELAKEPALFLFLAHA